MTDCRCIYHNQMCNAGIDGVNSVECVTGNKVNTDKYEGLKNSNIVIYKYK